MITNVKGEINETRVLLDEQNEKNELLERKFRKVDSELMEVIIMDNHDDIIDHDNDDGGGW